MADVITRLKYYASLLTAITNLLFASFYPLLRTEEQDLTGKIALVTGANSGLGYSIALSLAHQNATVYLACRNKARGEEAAANIINATGSKTVHVVELDTSSLENVRRFAGSWNHSIDILVHNAGIATTPSNVKTTSEGLGLIYCTNFLGSFLLTALLEDKLSSGARVVLTSSTGAFSVKPHQVLGNPKLAKSGVPDAKVYSATKYLQVAFGKALQQRWDRRGTQITAQSFTPGYALTSIFDKLPAHVRTSDYFFWILQQYTRFSISSDQGAVTGIWLATTDAPEVMKGGDFWDRCQRLTTPIDLLPQEDLDKMWQIWCEDSGTRWN